MSGKHILKGTLILTFAGLLSRFIGFFYRIFLSHTIGAQGLGYIQLIVPLQTLVLAISVSGIQSAISQLCASSLALGQKKRAGDLFWAGTVLSVFLSVLLTWVIYNHTAFFSSGLLKAPETQPLLRILALSFPLSALHACISSYYFARKCTGLPSVIQLLEQLARVGTSYLLYTILLSQGKNITPVIAVGGALAGEVVSAFVSLFCIGSYFIQTKYSFFPLRGIRKLYNELFKLSFPLTLNRVLLTLLGSIETVLIPQKLHNYGLSCQDAMSVFGIFTGMAMPLLLFPGALTNSAAVMLVPSIAELKALGRKKRIHSIINCLFLAGFSMGILCMLFFLLSGRFLGRFLFHSHTAGIYIQNLAFLCPFLYLNTILTSIINGLGKTNVNLLHSAISISIRMGFVIWAIPHMGIKGYLYGLLLGEIILTILHWLQLSRHIRQS